MFILKCFIRKFEWPIVPEVNRIVGDYWLAKFRGFYLSIVPQVNQILVAICSRSFGSFQWFIATQVNRTFGDEALAKFREISVANCSPSLPKFSVAIRSRSFGDFSGRFPQSFRWEVYREVSGVFSGLLFPKLTEF